MYQAALKAYESVNKSTMNGRDVEAAVLTKAALKLKASQDNCKRNGHDANGAAPSTVVLIDSISEHILQRQYYQALKLTKRLIQYEQEAIQHVSGSIESV